MNHLHPQKVSSQSIPYCMAGILMDSLHTRFIIWPGKKCLSIFTSENYNFSSIPLHFRATDFQF